MGRRVAVVAVTAGWLLTTVPCAAQLSSASHPTAAPGVTIDQRLAGAVARGDIPGVVAVAVNREGIIYQGAFGKADAAHGRPMTPDAIFRIASMTKAVTSVAAMQLYEQGRFSLDDPAEKYLPALANLSVFESFDYATGAYKVHPAARKVTIRHLLTHTSGLAYDLTSPIVRDFKPRRGEKYGAGPLLFEPGTRWIYGTGVDWVGRLVESLAGQNLEDYFREHIFRPLRMLDTFYNVPVDKQARLVTIHHRPAGHADAALVEQPVPAQTPLTVFNGGSGLASTAGDYSRLVRMLLNGGALDGARILSAHTVALMGRNHIGDLDVPAIKTALPERSMDFTFIAGERDKHGLGFLRTSAGVGGKRSAGSLSWGGINNTYFWLDPARGVGGVIMMQVLPFADTKALAAYDAFERGIYGLPSVNGHGRARRGA